MISASGNLYTIVCWGKKKMYQGEIAVQVDCLKLFDTNLATAVGKILDYSEKPSFYKLLLKNQANQWKCCRQRGCNFRKHLFHGSLFFPYTFFTFLRFSSFNSIKCTICAIKISVALLLLLLLCKLNELLI